MAVRWLQKGGSETGLMAQAGWTSRTMIDRYVKASSEALAASEFDRWIWASRRKRIRIGSEASAKEAQGLTQARPGEPCPGPSLEILFRVMRLRAHTREVSMPRKPSPKLQSRYASLTHWKPGSPEAEEAGREFWCAKAIQDLQDSHRPLAIALHRRAAPGHRRRRAW